MVQQRIRVPRAGERRRGASILEATLLCPWIFFIFAASFDLGNYLSALISTENAVRAAGLYYVSSARTAADAAKSCHYALEILKAQTNVRNAVAACASSRAAVNRSAPVALTITSGVAGPDSLPSTTVTVAYQTVPLIPIPLLLPGQLTLSRSVQFKE